MVDRWLLTLGNQRVAVRPRGGVVGDYWVGDRLVLAGAENPTLFAFRGSLLAPWPNRVVGGRWTWRGEQHQLPINDPSAGSALHGLVFDVDWLPVAITDAEITLQHALVPQPGYPFPLHLTVRYVLGPDGLGCTLTALNTGTTPAPVGLGVHPYVAGLVDDLRLVIPAHTVIETEATWQESARVPVDQAGLDFRAPEPLCGREIDAAFTDVIADTEGRSEARVICDGAEVVVWSGSTCRSWVVYSGHTLPEPDYRRSIAIEPMTCPPNAFNTGEVDVLEPGEELRLDWGFSLR